MFDGVAAAALCVYVESEHTKIKRSERDQREKGIS